MSYIDIHAINAAADMYGTALSKLTRMLEEIRDCRGKITKTGQYELLRRIDILENSMITEIDNMQRLESGLREAVDIYKAGIRWMDDVASGDEYVYPYTSFGVTYLEYLKKYADLMPFEPVSSDIDG